MLTFTLCLFFQFLRNFNIQSNIMAESPSTAEPKGKNAELPAELRYIQYEHPLEKMYLPSIRALISKDLSEPYSIYVYRYFLYQWNDLCFMVFPLQFLTTLRAFVDNGLFAGT